MDALISNPDSVILTQLFSIVNDTFQCAGGWKALVCTMGVGILKLAVSFLIHRLVKNGDVWNAFRFVLLRTVYRKRMLNRKCEEECAIIDAFMALLSSTTPSNPSQPNPSPAVTSTTDDMKSVWISGIPAYMDKEGMDYALYTLPYVHSAFLEQITSNALATVKDAEFIRTVIRDTVGVEFTPLDLFASDNYIALDKMISRYFSVRRSTRFVSTPFIVLNGEAGLGKSNSSHFLAKQGKYDEIRHISLIEQNMINRSFTSIITEVTSKKTNHSTIIYFDELDKYVDRYIRTTYSSSRKAPVEGVVVDDDFEVFASEVKTNIILSIAGLSGNFTSFPQGVVFVFCSNNFHTLFEGFDQIHVEAVKTRFTFIDFQLCGKDELCRYLTTFTERVDLPELRYSQEHLQAAFARIRPDLKVTYRDIEKTHGRVAYDIDVFVDEINNKAYNPLITSSKPMVHSIPSSSYVLPTVVPPTLQPIDPVVSFEEIKEKREKAKQNTIDVTVKLLMASFDMNLSNGEYHAMLLKETAGMDLIAIAEKTLPESCNVGENTLDMCLLNSISRYGRVESLEHLIRLGVDVNESDDLTECKPIQAALFESMRTSGVLRANIRKCVSILLSAGAELDFRKANIFRFILCSEYKPNLEDSDNEKWLLEILQEANKTKTYTVKNSVFGIRGLANSPYSANIIRYLCSIGCTPDYPDDPVSSINIAISAMGRTMVDFFSVIQALVECGANPGEGTGTSLLYMLASVKNVELIKPIAEYLLQHGMERVYRHNGYIIKDTSRLHPESKAFLDKLIGA